MLSYMKWRWKYYVLCTVLFFSFNLYFIFLMHDSHISYLRYLDLLLLTFSLLFVGADYAAFQKAEAEKKRLILQEEIISEQLSDFANKDIAEHDVQVLNAQIQKLFDENCELQDYVAKWCHELKIPLAASLLIVQKIKDAEQKKAMREQLEKMNGQLNSLLLGCKLQSTLFDLQIKRVLLPECVKTSIRNNQFFLIQKGFTLDIQVEPLYVYTDSSWLVYILDQLLSNAIKYAKTDPVLSIWAEQTDRSVRLFAEDHGEGIQEADLRRIFEKGFTGSNYHNGKYKSTGMGLYMVSKIITRLGHSISVESEYGSWTRFCITFPQ